MKRFIVGFSWFLGFFLSSWFLFGIAINIQCHLRGESDKERLYNTSNALDKSLSIFLLAAAGTAIAGTATRKLPGTRK